MTAKFVYLCALTVTLVFLACLTRAFAADPVRPDARLTPGATNPAITQANIAQTICVAGYANGSVKSGEKGVRNVPQSEKLAVYREYGITNHPNGAYEIDHLISIELGGSNDIKNLWPESYVTKPYNAHTKDKLEDRLHALVCAKKVSLSEAQTAIRTDWIATYRKYVGLLP